jgi:hypothetical protein
MPDIGDGSLITEFDVGLTMIGRTSNVSSILSIGNDGGKTLEKMACLSGTIQWKRLFKMGCNSDFLIGTN